MCRTGRETKEGAERRAVEAMERERAPPPEATAKQAKRANRGAVEAMERTMPAGDTTTAAAAGEARDEGRADQKTRADDTAHMQCSAAATDAVWNATTDETCT